jgi:DNA-binding NarL/FixJ family response regulator
MMKRPTVLLADDHVVLLQGVRELIGSEYDVVGTVTDGRALVAAAEKLRPDVVVADIAMPELNGIDAVERLRQSCPATKVVFLTMYKDTGLVKHAFQAGALGYVLKHAAVQELKLAIGSALQRRQYLSPAIRETLDVPLEALVAPSSAAGAELTPRQREVLQLIAEGKTIKEIAAVLGIAVKTAEFHRYRIMDALRIRTTAKLTRYAIEHGLTPLT